MTPASFYKAIQNDFYDMCDDFNNLVKEKPELIIRSDTPLNGMIGYCQDDDESTLHLLNPKDDSRKMFVDFSENADKLLSQELREMENLNSSFRWNKE
jgi:hypothetical protein